MSPALNIGLVGCGGWGRHILRDLGTLGADVHVVARGSTTRRNAEEGGARSIVEEVARLPGVDGFVVATPTITHAQVLDEIVDLGLPIFCEKALTSDVESARNLAARAPDHLFVMDKWRYHPGVEALRDIADSGELGDVCGIQATRLGWGNPHDDVDAVWILAPHDLSIALEILHEIPPAKAAVAEQIGGQVWSLTGQLGEKPWLTIQASGSSHRRVREIRVVGEHGIAWLPAGLSDRIGVSRPGFVGEPEWRSISTEMPLLRELRAFLEHIKGGPPPRSSAAEAAEIVSRIAELRALANVDSSTR